MNQKFIIFICEHGAAKSVVAAAHFNKLASERGLNVRAIARGTTPDSELSPKAVDGLTRDGLTPTESVPQKISLADVETAKRVVSFCDLPEAYHGKSKIERWDDVPPVSEDYEKARDAIVERINQLIKTLMYCHAERSEASLFRRARPFATLRVTQRSLL